MAVLEKTFGKRDIIFNTNTNIIALIEFAFFKAEGPYSPDFDKQVTVIKRILEIHPPMMDLLNRSANHAIGNMVLNARGRLKFTISDIYELMKVLRTWQYLGLNNKSHRSVFNAILAKQSIQKRLKRKDSYLIARLETIFPQWRNEINPSNIDVNQVIFKEQQSRFDTLIQSLREKGVSIDEMIQNENHRKIPVGVKRNNFLSYQIFDFSDFDFLRF